MSIDKHMTIQGLREEVRISIREQIDEIESDDFDEYDLVFEVCDSVMPVYNHTLFEVLLSCPDLWYAQSMTGMGETDCTPVSITQAVIFDDLREVANETINQWREEMETAQEEAAIAAHERRAEAKEMEMNERGEW